MKVLSLLLTCGLLAQSALMAAVPEPVLRYNFDQAGSTQNSIGKYTLDLNVRNHEGTSIDYTGVAPVKRKGAENSTALNLSAENVDADVPGDKLSRGGAEVSLTSTNAAFLRDDLGSFTITAWVLNAHASEPDISADRRIFSLRNGTSNQVVDLRLYNPKGSASNVVYFGLTGQEGGKLFYDNNVSVPANNQEWYFVSVSYDAVTGKVVIYSGEEGGVLTSATFDNTVNGSVNTLLSNSTLLGVGNVGHNHGRRLDAFLSDVRFYDQSLSASQIGEIYAIPEPRMTMVLGMGLLVVSIRAWRSLAR